MVEIKNLSNNYLDTPESHAAAYIESAAHEYFKKHKDISGFLIIVPSVYIFDQKRNDIDIAVFAHFPKFAVTDNYRIDSFAATIEVKSHSISDICRDSGGHYHVKYQDVTKDVTRQAFEEAISLRKRLSSLGIHCDFINDIIFFRSISEESLYELQNGNKDNTLAAQFTFEQLLGIIARQFAERDLHDTLKADESTYCKLSARFSPSTASAILRQKFELLCSESLEPEIVEIINGYTVIKGRAGTGKTLLLLKAATRIAENSDNKVLFLTYNHALLADVRKLINHFPYTNLTKDNFQTIDSFFQELMRCYNVIKKPINPYQSTDYKKDYQEALDTLLKRVKEQHTPSYAITHFILDEAQDMHEKEIEILKNEYPSSTIIAADGIDQSMRNDTMPEWKDAKIKQVHSCKRMFSNVATFVNLMAGELDCGWRIDCSDAYPGGRVIITDHYDTVLHEALLTEQRNHGCDDYDMLMLVDSRLTYDTELTDGLNSKIYDGRIAENRRIEPADDEVRLYHYQSCRGVEGWTVVCMALDRYYEDELKKRVTVQKELHQDNVLQTALDQTSRKMMIPLTRAIDTLVIVLSDKDNIFSKMVYTAANKCRDFTFIKAE